MAQGPLAGIRVVEFAGLGPGPFCAMLLADMGAEIVRIDRPGTPPSDRTDLMDRGRHRIAIDMKSAGGIETCLRLAEKADVVIEGYRPGVMERLGLGPDVMLARNPRLVYGRMTGWGQDGPNAPLAGHDINYIAISGALHAIGGGEEPVVPLNLVGDFGGGGLYLAMGICAALVERQTSGAGQVIDSAISDGAASLMTFVYGRHAMGRWQDRRDANILDGAAPYYTSYACADGKHIAVGPIEPGFYALLCKLLGDPEGLQRDDLVDRSSWPAQKARFAGIFRQRSRDEWCELLAATDACVAPVLSLGEAPGHHHNRGRETFVERGGIVQPNVAPRFSRTPSALQGPLPGEDGADVLALWNIAPA